MGCLDSILLFLVCSPAEDVSLSEATSQTGAASAAGKADSVIHLLPMLRFDGDLKLELDEPEAWVSLVEPSLLANCPKRKSSGRA